MLNHSENPQDEYHFESSEEYCTPEVIEKVKRAIEKSRKLTEPEQAQLQAIVKLELARYEYATQHNNIDEHGEEIQKIRYELVNKYGIEPFHNGAIDKAFYDALNREYGYER